MVTKPGVKAIGFAFYRSQKGLFLFVSWCYSEKGTAKNFDLDGKGGEPKSRKQAAQLRDFVLEGQDELANFFIAETDNGWWSF